MIGGGGGTTESTSEGQDLTPAAFKRLRAPLAEALFQSLGLNTLFGDASQGQGGFSGLGFGPSPIPGAGPVGGAPAGALGAVPGQNAGGQTTAAGGIPPSIGAPGGAQAGGQPNVFSAGNPFTNTPFNQTSGQGDLFGRKGSIDDVVAAGPEAGTGPGLPGGGTTEPFVPGGGTPFSPLLSGLSSLVFPFATPDPQGRLNAQIGPQEGAALNQLNQLAQGGGPNEAAANALLNFTLQSGFLSPQSNPFLQQTIDAVNRPVVEEGERNRQDLASLFTRAGQTVQDSSPFGRELNRASIQTARQQADNAAILSNQNLDRERRLQTQAVDQQRQQNQLVFDQARQNLEAQALPRLVADQGIVRGTQEFRERLALLERLFGLGFQVAGGTPVTATTSSSARGNAEISGEGVQLAVDAFTDE